MAHRRSGRRTALPDTLAGWLEAQGLASGPDGADAIADVARVRSELLAAARAGRTWSYAGLLNRLGVGFTRPRMRALCRTLDAVDAAVLLAGEPELAVLVVREGDGLPGQGWWTTRAAAHGYAGPWTGPEASAFVRTVQAQAFARWRDRELQPDAPPA